MQDIDVNQKKIMRLYTAFGAALIVSFVPSGIAALISLVLTLGVLVVAYAWRTDSEGDSLISNHSTFIIRTIWIGGFFALMTMSIAAIYLFKVLDNTPLEPCVADLMNFAQSGNLAALDILESSLKEKCWMPYVARNLNALIVSGVIGIGPVVFYFFARFMRGLNRARGGYRIAKPLAWF